MISENGGQKFISNTWKDMNKKTQMTTEELLIKLPAFIGRNWIVNKKGERIGYSYEFKN